MSNKLEDQLEDLSTECESLKSQIAHFQKTAQINISEINRLKEENEQLKSENNSLTEKANEITYELNTAQWQTMKDKIDELTNENATIKNNMNQLKQTIKNKELENERLKKLVDEYQSESVQNLHKYETKNKLINNHKQIQLQQNTKIKELSDQVEVMEYKLNEIQSTVTDDTLNRKNSSIRSGKGYLPAIRNQTLRVDQNAFTSPLVSPNAKHFDDNGLIDLYSFRSDSPIDIDNALGVNINAVLKQKDEQYQSLIETQKNEYEMKIKTETENNEYQKQIVLTQSVKLSELKEEIKRLKIRLDNAWEFNWCSPMFK
eukprot:141755_1